MHTQIQDKHDTQAWTRPIHHRLDIKAIHHENKDEESTDRTLQIYVIDISTNILACMTIKEIQDAMQGDEHLRQLLNHNRKWIAFNQERSKHDICLYWTFLDDLVIIDGVTLKGQRFIIPASFREQGLEQLHTWQSEQQAY